MKVRVMKRYDDDITGAGNGLLLESKPYYEVDVWKTIFWKFGYWQTQLRTVDFNYAASVFDEYKSGTRGAPPPKDAAVLIHYE